VVLQLGGLALCKQLLTVKTYHVMSHSKISVLLTKYCSSGQIEKNEMNGECSMYVIAGKERCIQG
jgi:hypothetical protein